MRAFYIAAAVGTAACSVFGQSTEVRLFRVNASTGVGALSIDAEGVVSWDNHPPGEMVQVEAIYGAEGSSEWEAHTHVISEDVTGSVRAFDHRTPSGFSVIPAGTFLMGSPKRELGRESWENQHRVTLTRDFHLQKTEVTNRQMADVMNWAHGQGLVSVSYSTVRNLEGNQQELLDLDSERCQISWNWSRLVVDAGKEEYPCIEVTWYGAQAYCNYRSDIEALGRAVDFSDWGWAQPSIGCRRNRNGSTPAGREPRRRSTLGQ